MPGARRFATTQWSLVLAAGDRGAAGGEEALAQLCALYWFPVFAFVRRQGHAADEAEDLVQGFFARLIEKGDLADADRSRGRFRSFLLASCQHYLHNARDRARATKRGGGRPPIPFDVAEAEGRLARALAHEVTPERLYERQWGLTLMAAVLDDVRRHYGATGRAVLFERLKEFLTGDDTVSYGAAASELATSPGAVKVAVHRLRQRYRAALKQRVADTLATGEDVDDEMRYLLKVLAGV